MKTNNFLRGTLVLIICNLIGKVIGAVYRIPLTNIIGGEGMGQYQLTFPLYCLILTIATSGIPVAISKMVAEFNSKDNFLNSKKLLKISLIFLTLISALSAIFVVFFAKTISIWQGNPDIYICYYAITPAILFVGILSAFRGFFQGNLMMYPTAFSNLIEQIIKLIAGLFLAKKFLDYGVVFAVFGAILGISFAELVACLFLIICYIAYSKKFKNFNNDVVLSNKLLARKLFALSVPITFGGLIAPLTALVDSLLVVNLLMIDGFSGSSATMMLGIQSGVVEPLVNIPVIIAVSISTVLLPSISELASKNKINDINLLVKKSYKMSLSIAFSCFVCFVIFGKQILSFLYGSSLGGYELSIALKLLYIGGLNIIFLSLVQVSAGVLQGLGYHKFPVYSLIAGCIIKIIFDVLLILTPTINIMGTVLAGGICYISVLVLNTRKIKKLTKIEFKGAFSQIIIQQACICVVAYVFNSLFLRFFSQTISLFMAAFFAGVIFLMSFYVLFIYNKKEKKVLTHG